MRTTGIEARVNRYRETNFFAPMSKPSTAGEQSQNVTDVCSHVAATGKILYYQ
ncbi:hypothetical protein AVEN_162628-1, partial [Araneus ventricosus]